MKKILGITIFCLSLKVCASGWGLPSGQTPVLPQGYSQLYDKPIDCFGCPPAGVSRYQQEVNFALGLPRENTNTSMNHLVNPAHINSQIYGYPLVVPYQNANVMMGHMGMQIMNPYLPHGSERIQPQLQQHYGQLAPLSVGQSSIYDLTRNPFAPQQQVQYQGCYGQGCYEQGVFNYGIPK